MTTFTRLAVLLGTAATLTALTAPATAAGTGTTTATGTAAGTATAAGTGTAPPTATTPQGTGTGTGRSQYAGTVPLSTTRTGTTYQLRDPSRGDQRTLDALNQTSGPGVLFTDADNVWGSGTAANRQTAAVDVHYGTAVTWDFYLAAFGRAASAVTAWAPPRAFITGRTSAMRSGTAVAPASVTATAPCPAARPPVSTSSATSSPTV